jgi:hypothetical protein
MSPTHAALLRMTRHVLSLRYDGLRATRGELRTGASKQVVQGAQMFLGAHAHYFLSGLVPDRIGDKAAGFEIMDLARERGSWEAEFAVDLHANGVWEAIKFGFGAFLYQSYRAWADGLLFEEPLFERREPALAAPAGAGEPVFHSLSARQFHQERLAGRIGQAVVLMTAPLGTSAATLEMSLDGRLFAIWDRRYVTEDEITDAVMLFRQGRGHGRRLS